MPIRRNPCLTHHRRRFSERLAALRAFRPRSELTSATLGADSYAYAFDDIGNRLSSMENSQSRTYVSNSLNQYSSITNPVISPTYDDDGNMLSDGEWAFAWDAENRLISAAKGTTRLEFAYDSLSRRCEKKVYESDQLVKHEKYVYLGFKLLAVRYALNGNEQTAAFLWQPFDFDVPLCMDRDGETLYFLTDGNKNVVGLFDAAGTRTATYVYAPFGALLSASGDKAAANPFRFSSEFFDAETGLVYYNYRYYSPPLGRWLSRDPLGLRGGSNAYAMLANRLVNHRDNLGLKLKIELKAHRTFVAAEITYIPERDDCCDSIKMRQFARVIDLRTNKPHHFTEQENDHRNQIDEDGWFNDASPHEYYQDHFSYLQRLNPFNSAFLAGVATGSAKPSDSEFYDWFGFDLESLFGQDPSDTNAVISDMPGFLIPNDQKPDDVDLRFDFRTIVECESGRDEQKQYGSVEWGFELKHGYVDANTIYQRIHER